MGTGCFFQFTYCVFYTRRYYDWISKFKIGLKSLFRQGLSEPEFYSDLVYNWTSTNKDWLTTKTKVYD